MRTQVNRENVSHKFIELSMETPHLCPGVGHNNGSWKSIKHLEFTSAINIDLLALYI